MKLDKINEDIAKTKDKIAALQSRLRELERRKTETENSEIIALVRTMNADTPGDFDALLETLRLNGGIPADPHVEPPSTTEPYTASTDTFGGSERKD